MEFHSIKLDGLALENHDDIRMDEVPENDIAIIGIALKLPMANTVEEFHRVLRMGVDCVRELPSSRKTDADGFFHAVGTDPAKVKYGEAAYLDEIDKFDYPFFKLSPKEASLLDPNQRLFLETAWNSIEDAGCGGGRLQGSRTGVYVGYGSDSDYKKMIERIEPDSVSMSMPGNIRPIIASRLSYLLDLKGPSLIVDTTCSSSLVAVHLACQALRTGECDLAVAGGIQIHLLPVREFEVGIESSTSRTRTFDDASDGTGTGEGAVAMVLKPLYKAQQDRDPIYAVIKSSVVNQDGSSVGITAPHADAQADVIAEAWKKAAIDPESIAYIETHGTGTKLGDPIEIEGIQKAFGKYTDKKQFCAIGSLKSNIGHLDNAAGIAGLLKAVLSLKYKELFPTLHVTRPNRKIPFEESPVFLNNRLANWDSETGVRRCGVSSFGISGTNCHVVLEEAPAAPCRTDGSLKRPQLFVLSAKSEAALHDLAQTYAAYLKTHSTVDLADLGYTLSTGRSHYPYRLAFVSRDARELSEALSSFVYPGSSEEGADAKEASRAGNAVLKEYADGGKQDDTLLQELCLLYAKGADIEWHRLYRSEKRQRLHLPAYPFEKKRCWLPIPGASAVSSPAGLESNAQALYYQAIWTEQALTADRKDDKWLRHRYLILKDGEGGLGHRLSEKLRKAGCKVTEARLGEKFERLNEFAFTTCGTMADYLQLLQEIGDEDVTRVIHLSSLWGQEDDQSLRNLEQRLERGVYSLFHWVQAMAESGRSNPMELFIVSDHAQEVSGNETRIRPANSALFGLGKVIGWEHKNVRVRCIDIETADDFDGVMAELKIESNEYKAAYRGGQRYVERIDEYDKSGVHGGLGPMALKSDGVYILTGGLGGIGLHIAKRLASQGPINLALINRSAFPDPSQWDDILRENTNKRNCGRITAIREMEQMGARVQCVSADISNEAEVNAAIGALKQRYGKINGVVHAAGIGAGNYLSGLAKETFAAIIAPKVQGTWLLDRATREEPLDFFAMFSSAITLVGGVGSGPYTAANSYLDAFASCRRQSAGRTVVMNWPAWNDTGLSEGTSIDEEKELFQVLPVPQGILAFEDVLNRGIRQSFIGNWNLNGHLFELGDRLPFRLSGTLQRQIAAGKTEQAPRSAAAKTALSGINLKGKVGSEYTDIEQKVAQAWIQVLGYEELDIHDNFFEIGGDSILLTRVHAKIAEYFPGKISIADLFSYTTIAQISEFLQGSEHMDEPASSTRVTGAGTGSKDIAVIGLSVRMPDAEHFAQYWENISGKRESIKQYPPGRQKDCEGFIRNFTGLRKQDIQFSYGGFLDQVDEFDYSFFNLSPKEALLMDPNQRMFLEASWQAIEDAGYGGGKLVGSRTGVYLGYADWPVYGQYITKKHPSLIQLAGAGNTPSLIASRISYLLDLKGPAFLVDTACSSSLVAVHLACMALKDDECEMAIAGGVKVCLMPVDGVSEIGIESSNRQTWAFDDSSDGTVWGEGTVALLLKPLDRAVADRDRIYAVIKGSAINQDGASIGITAPNAPAQEKVLVKAWEQAGIDPETITYIEAHGTGTKLGDPVEIEGIQRAFRRYTDKKQFCAIGSVKTNIGHLDSTSGVAGLAKAIGALVHKELPPTLHFSRPNRKIAFEQSPVYVNDRASPWETDEVPRRCGVSSFGFSGTNCHIVLEEAPVIEDRPHFESGGSHILTLSGKNGEALKDLIHSYREFTETLQADLRDICYTSNTGRGHYTHRLAIVASDQEDLRQKLNVLCVNGLDGLLPEGTFAGEHRMITVQKEKMQQGELTSGERRRLSEDASGVLNMVLRHPNPREEMDELGRLYVSGADIDWESLYADEPRRKVQVPLYPFQRSRCWIELEPEAGDREPPSPDQQQSEGWELSGEEEAAPPPIHLKGREDNRYKPLEVTLGQAWGKLLGIREIDIYDDFFELGGNSLSAIQLEMDLKKYRVSVSSDEIYQFRCIKELAEHLEGGESEPESGASPAKPIGRPAKPTGRPVHAAQERADSIDLEGDAVILPRFTPFNDIFYKNCFYNSMFPVVGHFGQSILPFLVNDLIVYEYTEGRYSAGYQSLHPLEPILEQAGLRVDTRTDNADIVEELMACLQEGKPVVAWVDSFYVSIRPDVYGKQHLDHTLLVYGYNRQAQVFYIIEHDRRENLSYKKRLIPFEDVRKACRGFTENYVKQGLHLATHFVFQQASVPTGQESAVRMFAKNMAANRDKIEVSLNVLDRFIETYCSLTLSKEGLKEHCVDWVEFFNQVITTKQVEAYRLTRLFGQGSEELEALDVVLRKWDFVRKGIARFIYQPDFKPEVFAAGYEKLVELAAVERKFNALLFAHLEVCLEKIS